MSNTTLRNAIIQLCQELRPVLGPPAVIRTDPAPRCLAPQDDQILCKHNLVIECGRKKNVNKNPIGEKAVQEVEEEILREEPHGNPISPVTLSLATGCLNSRIRSTGLSAREMWTQRDQYTNEQLLITDMLLLQQKSTHLQTHRHSELSKAPKGNILKPETIQVGDLVYLYADRSKSAARDKYLVVIVDGTWCNIRKFVGSQLRNMSYRVKLSECYRVYREKPPSPKMRQDPMNDDLTDHDVPLPSANVSNPADTIHQSQCNELSLPHVPDEITLPIDCSSDPALSPTVRSNDTVTTSSLPSSVPVLSSPSEEIVSSAIELLKLPPTSTSIPEPLLSDAQLRRPNRAKRPPSYLKDYDLWER